MTLGGGHGPVFGVSRYATQRIYAHLEADKPPWARIHFEPEYPPISQTDIELDTTLLHGGRRPQTAPALGWGWDAPGPNPLQYPNIQYPKKKFFLYIKTPLNIHFLPSCPLFTLFMQIVVIEVDIWIFINC